MGKGCVKKSVQGAGFLRTAVEDKHRAGPNSSLREQVTGDVGNVDG